MPRRDATAGRPSSVPSTANGQQHLPPEMHVSMKVNIVSDGPGGISFSQAVTTPSAFHGLYDYAQSTPDDQQQQYALTYPDSSVEKAGGGSTEPLIQMPTTDTSQENAIGMKTTDGEEEKKKHRHHRHKHREKKEGDDQSVTRSQSASSLATSSVKITEVSSTTAEKPRQRKSKHHPHKNGDESSTATSRRSSSATRSRRAPKMQPEGESVVIVEESRRLDELLSEVVINTFADEEPTVGGGGRLITPDRSHPSGAQIVEDIAVRKLIAQTKFHHSDRYPIPVETPVAPVKAHRGNHQADDPYLVEDRTAIQSDESWRERTTRPKTPTDLIEEAVAPMHDLMRHLAEATAGLIEASRAVLESRAQTPQLYQGSHHESEGSPPPPPQAQVRISKETLIDDPAIPDFEDDKEHYGDRRAASGLLDDNSYERRRVQDEPRETSWSHGQPSSNGRASRTSGGDRSFERPPPPSDEDHHHHHHHNHHNHLGPEHHDGSPGVYYMHTYCAICGSPRQSRRAVSGGTISPNQAYFQSNPIHHDEQQVRMGRDHFLVHIRPNGEDEIIRDQSPPASPLHRRLHQQPPALPSLPPPPPPQLLSSSNGDRDRGASDQRMVIVKESEEQIYYHVEEEEMETRKPPREVLQREDLDSSIGSQPQPVPKDYMDSSNRSGSVSESGDPRLFTLSNFEDEDNAYSVRERIVIEKRPDSDITAEARARLRELQLLSCDTSSLVQIGRPLQMFSPDGSVATTETSGGDNPRYEIPLIRDAIIGSTARALGRTVPPVGREPVVQRPVAPTATVGFKEALEQRRAELARQREAFFGPAQSRDPVSMGIDERHTVYVPPRSSDDHRPPSPRLVVSPPPDMDTIRESGTEENGQGFVEEPRVRTRKTVQFDEKVETVEETVISTTTKIARRDPAAADIGEADRSWEYQPSDELYYDQSDTDHYAANRPVPSAKIFQLHTKPPPSSNSSFGVREAAVSTSMDPSGMDQNEATVGGGLDVRSDPYGGTADRENQIVRTLVEDESITSRTSSKRVNDLYRKALVGGSSRGGSSINSERSSVSNSATRGIGGAFTTAEVDRFLEDDYSDYGHDRLTPIDDWMFSRGGSDMTAGTRSGDSLASETSYRADVAHDFYGESPVRGSSSSSNRRSPVTDPIREKSFADIMRERSAVRNARLLAYSYGPQQPPPSALVLDRIEEQENEGGGGGRASSTVTTASDRTMRSGTDSIDREGSGIFAVRPTMGKLRSSTNKSALLTAAMFDRGSSSLVGSELENTDDYSQGRISPMIDIGNDHTSAGTISSYGELSRDTIRMAHVVSREPTAPIVVELDEPSGGFVGYGRGKERRLANYRSEINTYSSSDENRIVARSEPKRLRQTDL